MKNWSAVIRMLRLRALSVIVIFAAVAFTANGQRIESHALTFVLIIIILAAWYMHGTCCNDLADEAIDKINLKHAVGRPLANGKASRRQLWVFACGAGLICVVTSLFVSWLAAGLSVCALVLNWAYSMKPVRISYRGIIAPLLLPLGYVAYPFILAGLVQDIKPDGWTWLLMIALYITFCGRIILKDFRDVKGDSQYGKRTFIVRHGARPTIVVSSILWTLGSGLVAVLFSQRSILLSVITVVYAAGVLVWLRLLNRTTDMHTQQIVIGALARLATVLLLCMVIVLDQFIPLARLSTTVANILVLALAMYGAILSAQAIRQPERERLVY